MDFGGFIETFRLQGVNFGPKDNFFSDQVIEKDLQVIFQAIQQSSSYREFLKLKEKNSTASWDKAEPKIKASSAIYDYLYGYSIRKNISGKLCQIVYLIIEAVKNIFHLGSDKTKSIKEIALLYTTQFEVVNEQLVKEGKPSVKIYEAEKFAKTKVKEMLISYNQFILDSKKRK